MQEARIVEDIGGIKLEGRDGVPPSNRLTTFQNEYIQDFSYVVDVLMMSYELGFEFWERELVINYFTYKCAPDDGSDSDEWNLLLLHVLNWSGCTYILPPDIMFQVV